MKENYFANSSEIAEISSKLLNTIGYIMTIIPGIGMLPKLLAKITNDALISPNSKAFAELDAETLKNRIRLISSNKAKIDSELEKLKSSINQYKSCLNNNNEREKVANTPAEEHSTKAIRYSEEASSACNDSKVLIDKMINELSQLRNEIVDIQPKIEKTFVELKKQQVEEKRLLDIIYGKNSFHRHGFSNDLGDLRYIH